MPHLAAIILAAGGSTRLGTPKQLISFQGESLLRRAVAAALRVCDGPVVVVVGARSDAMRHELGQLDVKVSLNEQWERGIGSSIRVGMEAVLKDALPPPSAVLICLSDQPLVREMHLRALMQARTDQNKEICVSRYGGSVGPPVIVGQTFFEALLALPDGQGAKGIWLQHPDRCGVYDCAAGAIDIDTPEDVEALRTLESFPAARSI